MGRLTRTQGRQSEIVGQDLMQVTVAVVPCKVTKETWVNSRSLACCPQAVG